MNETTQKNLNEFISWHIGYQLKSLMLADRANNIGMTGFAHMYHMESADAQVHTRRIMNYMMMTDTSYEVNAPSVKNNFQNQDILQLLGSLIAIKKEGLALTNKLAAIAHQTGDFATFRFYEWYLIDFTQEIDEQQQIFDYMEQHPTSIPRMDQQAEKRSEPDTEVVRKPFTINAQ